METVNATSNIRLTGPGILVGMKIHRRTQKSPHANLGVLELKLQEVYFADKFFGAKLARRRTCFNLNVNNMNGEWITRKLLALVIE